MEDPSIINDTIVVGILEELFGTPKKMEEYGFNFLPRGRIRLPQLKNPELEDPELEDPELENAYSMEYEGFPSDYGEGYMLGKGTIVLKFENRQTRESFRTPIFEIDANQENKIRMHNRFTFLEKNGVWQLQDRLLQKPLKFYVKNGSFANDRLDSYIDAVMGTLTSGGNLTPTIVKYLPEGMTLSGSPEPVLASDEEQKSQAGFDMSDYLGWRDAPPISSRSTDPISPAISPTYSILWLIFTLLI